VRSKGIPYNELLVTMVRIMNNIFNMFGPSPIRPIEQHMHKVYHCAKQLIPFFDVVLSGRWADAEIIGERIACFEKEADLMKRDLRLHLPPGLFLPVARTDLLELLTAQDRIANKAEDIVGLVLGRKMALPATLIPLFTPFLAACIHAAKLACKAINELDELLETGFRGSEVKLVEGMIITLDEAEHQCDEQLLVIRQSIFNEECVLPVLDIIFLYKLVEWVGDLADCAQTVGGRLQILIAR
jgi:predicted phosphate transport protein (TIGR00153 family)